MNIIFDFGNVLVRWEPERVYLPYFGGDKARHWYFWGHICDKRWRDLIDAGADTQKSIRQLQSQYPDYAEAIALYQSRWEEMLPGEMPGMRELVQQLKADPAWQVYGLTNWSMETFPAARRRFGILQLIDNYVVSGDVKLVKPDPRIFQLLLDRYRLTPADCIFVDDNDDNVQAARALGMQGICFHGADELRKALGMSPQNQPLP